MEHVTDLKMSKLIWNKLLLKKVWLIPVISVLMIDVHLQFLMLVKQDVLSSSISDYFFILCAVTLLSLPCIWGLNTLITKLDKGNAWPIVVAGLVVYPSCLVGLNSMNLFASSIYDVTQFFTVQTWILLLAASALAYWSHQSNKADTTIVKTKLINLMFSLDKVCVLLAILWAFLLAAIFAPYDQPMMNQPLPMVIDSSKLTGNLLNFANYFVQLMVLAILVLSVFLLNRYVLIRQVLSTYGVIYFVLSVLFMTVVLTPLYVSIVLYLPLNDLPSGITNLTPSGGENIFDPINYQFTFMVLAISTPVILAFERQGQETQVALIKQEQTQTELKLLQQQVNPHFLFNTLNNLYALTLKKSDQAPELVMQLSNLLRYSVYEGQKDLVDLSQEIGYLENYWSLQSIRVNYKASIEVTWPENTNGLKIPPLLLINILENAFKHGVEPSNEKSFLKFEVRVIDTQLAVCCCNSIPENKSHEAGGVGLTNLKRRLHLLYGDNAKLEIVNTDKEWTVQLDMALERNSNEEVEHA